MSQMLANFRTPDTVGVMNEIPEQKKRLARLVGRIITGDLNFDTFKQCRWEQGSWGGTHDRSLHSVTHIARNNDDDRVEIRSTRYSKYPIGDPVLDITLISADANEEKVTARLKSKNAQFLALSLLNYTEMMELRDRDERGGLR